MTVVRFALIIVFTVVFGLLTPMSALAMPRSEDCRTFLSQKKYEATGARLIVTKPADLSHFPRGFFCPTCFGAGGFKAFVAADGSVGVLGWEHIAIYDHSKPFFSKEALWRPGVVSERIAATRYEPPRVSGKPVCVLVNFNWMIEKPTELLRWDEDQ